MWQCDDGVSVEFYACSERVARKQYRCCECSAVIERGEKHVYACGKSDGRFWSARQHLLCCEACELIRDAFEEDCINFGGLKDAFHEMRRHWCPRGDTIEKAKRLRSLMAQIKWRERKGRQTP